MPPTPRRRLTHARAPLVPTCFALTVAVMLCAQAMADEGITVSGQGQVKLKPNQVEIGAMVSGEAELAADAQVKFRDARKRAVAALEALKLGGLAIDSQGSQFNQALDPNAQMQMMQGRMAAAVKPKIQIAEQLKITLKDADKLEQDKMVETVLKIIDTGRDAGLQIGPATPTNYYQYQVMLQNGQGGQAMVTFKVGDPIKAREQAYKDAMDDAKSKAQRLADLAGVKLGRITAVTDSVPMKGNENNAAMAMWMAQQGMAAQTDSSDLSSAMFGEIPLRVNLTVHFEIGK